MASFEPRGNSIRAVVRVPQTGKKKSATFDTMAEAEAWAWQTEKAVKAMSVAHARAGDATVARMLTHYSGAVAENMDSARWSVPRLARWCTEPLGAMRVVDVTTHDINAWISARLRSEVGRTGRKISPGSVSRELTLLSAAFTYGVSSLKWIDVNPCHGASRPAEPPPRGRALLLPAEIKALCQASGYESDPGLRTIGARVGACFLLALETGMRSGEILRLRPADYDRNARTIKVAAEERGGRKSARSGKAVVSARRTVPLTSRAVDLLDQLLDSMPADQQPQDGMAMPPYIVGINDAQRDANWRKAVRLAGVQDLHYHDTKHEACTRLAKHIDVLALSHAIGTKDVRLLRDTYYADDAERTARLLPSALVGN